MHARFHTCHELWEHFIRGINSVKGCIVLTPHEEIWKNSMHVHACFLPHRCGSKDTNYRTLRLVAGRRAARAITDWFGHISIDRDHAHAEEWFIIILADIAAETHRSGS
jgi:hypothetical protein